MEESPPEESPPPPETEAPTPPAEAPPSEAVEADPEADPEAAADPESDPETSEEPPPDTGLSSVVVTALRREQRVQDVPIAMNVVDGDDALDENVTTTNEVERLSPNLSAQSSGGRSSRPRWFLRGIGTNDPSVNLESPVGIYQDETFIAYVPGQSFPIFDLERIEVLRGPQGTLWGKNTTGGAVHFVSRRPTLDPSGYLRLGIGNYDSRLAEGAFGGPILAERIAARAAFYYEEQGGWATNLRDESRDPELNDFAARVSVLANVTDDLEVLLIGRFRLLNGGVNPIYPVGAQPDGTIRQYAEAPNTFRPGYGRDPQVGDSFYRGPTTNHLETIGATLNVAYHIGDYTLTSITAIDGAEHESSTLSYWPDLTFDQTGTFSDVSSRTISSELRIASPAEDQLSWIAGLSYFNWHLFSDSGLATFGPSPARRSYIDNRFQEDNTALAAFGNLRARLFEGLSVSGGVRYTYDVKYVDAQRLSGRGAMLNFADRSNWQDPQSQFGLSELSISNRADWSEVTFDVTPEYRFSDDAMVYFRFARGFRAGTFNPTIIPPAGDRQAYLPRTDPEILWDFELGAKTSFLDDRLVVELAGFVYLLENVQLNVQQPNPMGIPGANTSIVSNAAGGRAFGGELDVSATPIDDLQLRGGLGLLHTEYTDFTTFQGAETVDASGNAFYRAPNVSLTLGGEWRIPIDRENAFAIATDWSYRSRVYHNAVVQDDPQQQTPDYAIGNAEVRFSTLEGRITILAYMRNITGTSWRVLSQVVNLGAYPTSLGSPRTFGLQIIGRY
ncbi:Hypothetical protein I5071_60580 [Sandaracinus amylolyticus]|nr:Hypothetical protein I5071_60580 [Sandaracinus amylolyticus]